MKVTITLSSPGMYERVGVVHNIPHAGHVVHRVHGLRVRAVYGHGAVRRRYCQVKKYLFITLPRFPILFSFHIH